MCYNDFYETRLELLRAPPLSLVGDGDGKPAFWPSGVRSGLRTAARASATNGEGAPTRLQTRGRNQKSATVRLSALLWTCEISRHRAAVCAAATAVTRRLRRTSAPQPRAQDDGDDRGAPRLPPCVPPLPCGVAISTHPPPIPTGLCDQKFAACGHKPVQCHPARAFVLSPC